MAETRRVVVQPASRVDPQRDHHRTRSCARARRRRTPGPAGAAGGGRCGAGMRAAAPGPDPGRPPRGRRVHLRRRRGDLAGLRPRQRPGRAGRLARRPGPQLETRRHRQLPARDVRPRRPARRRAGRPTSRSVCARPTRPASTWPAVRTARSAPAIRCGVYLVTEGDVRTAVLLRGAAPEMGQNSVSVQIVSTDRRPRPGGRGHPGGSPWSTTSSAARCSRSGRRCSGTARRCCSSTAGPR